MMKTASPSRIYSLLLALSLGLGACATTPTAQPLDAIFAPSDPARATFDAWFAAEHSADNLAESPGKDASIPQHFAHAEIAYFDGDLERAADLYLHMLTTAPAHPLSRLAAVRLYTMRDEVTDFHARVRPALQHIRLGDVPPLTRVALNRLGQVLHWHAWNISALEQPFEADALGFATTWMTTPRMSPWRLTDFARSFPPEQQPALQPTYPSPYFAEDTPANAERTRPYQTATLNLAPGFERSGIYYLETFAHVGADTPARDFLLYANFPSAARVWIDDTLVLERNEDAYGTNELLRPIRLSPGTHRILIKLAYQKGYRNNFDLAFLADDATPLENSGLTFAATPNPAQNSPKTAKIELLDAPKPPAALEPVLIAPKDVSTAADIALYLTLNAAYLDLEAQHFEAAWDELTTRHPEFAPAYMLRARQIQTLWEVPSRIRDARALADLRRAHQLAPNSLSNRARLGRWLRNQGRNDDELHNLLRQNRDDARTPDGRLKNVTALYEWARFLDAQSWSEPAEQAWYDLMKTAPGECSAANSLAQVYRARGYFPPLESITPAWQQCPELIENRTLARADQQAERLAIYRRYAARYPLRSGPQLRYARELTAQGQPEEARSVLTAAAARIPWSSDLPYESARLLLADKGPDAARAEILAAMDAQKDYASLHWRLAALENHIPLQTLMHDAKKEALAEVARTALLADPAADSTAEVPSAHAGGDEAYYVLDFAARKFFPDGSAITLTHNLIRVMNKGAIDRFGEFSAPEDAHMVQIRTIKQDGSVRVPEYTPGKSTLSMPGLAPGDFVEFAYIQYSAPNQLSRTRREGIRFFFRMGDISSRRSEFLVLGADGDFQKANQAPDTETIDTPEGPALRFLRVDSPHPRREPSQVGWEEYLPWVQLHHEGLHGVDGFEAARRTIAEGIRDSLKMSPQVRRQIAQWRDGLQPGTADEVTQLYYRVAQWIADPRMDDFSTDISHALLERSGNPMMLLKATYDAAGIPADIYLVKSQYHSPTEYKVAEFSKYRTPLLKVTLPDQTAVWLDPDGPDAMFNTINLSTLGQPAICVSCPTPHTETIPTDHSRPATRAVHVDGTLDVDGTLAATMTLTYHGARAAMLRAALRQNADPSSRQKLVDLTLANILPGASLQSFDIDDLPNPDRPLVIRARFERPDFAHDTAPGTMNIQTQLFPEGIAAAWAELATRETPLLLPYQSDFDYSFQVELPPGTQASLRSRQGDWSHQSAFGTYTRSAQLEQNTLHIHARMQMPVQRVAPADYAKFRQWATDIDRSALLFVDLKL